MPMTEALAKRLSPVKKNLPESTTPLPLLQTSIVGGRDRAKHPNIENRKLIFCLPGLPGSRDLEAMVRLPNYSPRKQ